MNSSFWSLPLACDWPATEGTGRPSVGRFELNDWRAADRQAS
jgi:hypothetical protein